MLGVSTVGIPGTDTERQMALIAGAGFDCVFTMYNRGDPIKKWADAAEKNGHFYEALHAPFGGVNSLWEEGAEGEDYLAFMLSRIDGCAEIGVGKCVMHVTVGSSAPPVSEIGMERFRRMCNYGHKKNVRLAFENLEPLPHIDSVMTLADGFHGFLWDCGHNLCYTPHIDMPAKFGASLIGVHVHDNRGVTRPGDIHYRDDLHLLPFDGTLDWQWFADKLRAMPSVPLTLELSRANGMSAPRAPIDYSAMDPSAFFAEAYERAQKLREMTGC